MRLLLLVLVAPFVAILLGLALWTFLGTRAIEARYPPVGRFVAVAGTRVHVLDVPAPASAAPPIVFLHGASGNLNDLAVALRAPLEGKARLLFVDRPGHGWSDRPRADLSSPTEQAAVVAGLLDALGVPRAVVVGHSLGGAVAAAFAVHHPDKTAALVLLSPATHPWPTGIAWYYSVARMPVLGWLMAHTIALPASTLVVGRVVQVVFAPQPVPADYLERAAAPLVFRPAEFLANTADVAGLNAAVAALQPRYREIRAPTIVVTGDRDAVVWPQLHAEGLRRDIAGAELVVLPGIGHMPHHVATGAVVAAIERALARALPLAEPR